MPDGPFLSKFDRKKAKESFSQSLTLFEINTLEMLSAHVRDCWLCWLVFRIFGHVSSGHADLNYARPAGLNCLFVFVSTSYSYISLTKC